MLHKGLQGGEWSSHLVKLTGYKRKKKNTVLASAGEISGTQSLAKETRRGGVDRKTGDGGMLRRRGPRFTLALQLGQWCVAERGEEAGRSGQKYREKLVHVWVWSFANAKERGRKRRDTEKVGALSGSDRFLAAQKEIKN